MRVQPERWTAHSRKAPPAPRPPSHAAILIPNAQILPWPIPLPQPLSAHLSPGCESWDGAGWVSDRTGDAPGPSFACQAG